VSRQSIISIERGRYVPSLALALTRSRWRWPAGFSTTRTAGRIRWDFLVLLGVMVAVTADDDLRLFLTG
jgi:hypothetical protein